MIKKNGLTEINPDWRFIIIIILIITITIIIILFILLLLLSKLNAFSLQGYLSPRTLYKSVIFELKLQKYNAWDNRRY